MEYYAGLFDAEGCVSLTPGGSIKIRLNNTNKEVPTLFKERFGGTIYTEISRKNKTIFSWYLNADNFENFCKNIIPHSLVKKEQLETLFHYKNSSRLKRREIRKDIVHQIASSKKPLQVKKDYFGYCNTLQADASFYKWLAGFIEGDGSIRIHENHIKPGLFSTQIGAGNIFPEPIRVIYQRIKGSLTQSNIVPHVMWKWICSESAVKSLLTEIYPYLISKKRQAKLVLDFLKIKESKKHNDAYTHEQVNQIRSIISEIKHYNSC